jgi:hypothetical protein
MAVYGLVLLAALQVASPCLTDPRFDFGSKTFDGLIGTGKFLGEKYPGRTLAVEALGKISFFSRLYTQDMMGLADPVIAHMPVSGSSFEPGHLKFDPDYTLSRGPDLIALGIFPNRDLACGLSRSKHERAGYHLEYLVDTGRPAPPGPHILEVGNLDGSSVYKLIVNGFNLAIPVRN